MAVGARFPGGIWLLDCGNTRNSGQVLLGNTMRPEALRGAFRRGEGRCRALPAPGLQRPNLLVSPPEPIPTPHLDCAEAVAQELQGPTINQVVAAIAASIVEKLLAGSCTWMGAYFDSGRGHAAPGARRAGDSRQYHWPPSQCCRLAQRPPRDRGVLSSA